MTNTSAQQALFDRHLAPTSPFPFRLEIERAQGSWLYTPSGKAYLDLIAGVAVSNLGHRHPKVVAALEAQLQKHLHLMVYGEYVQSSPTTLAETLVGLLPEELNCCYLTNSGAEAVEGALKLAKRITNRKKIVAFRGAYHGSTHGALSVSGNETKKRAFRPLLPEIYFIPFNDESALNTIDNQTAAVIIEPVQGDAGIRIPSLSFLQALRQKCNDTGAQLIFDEIQSGIGRTGKMFAMEHFRVYPDILCLAKALGGGLPLGTFVASRQKMALLTAHPMLGHITTFGGNPLSCAAAVATLEVLQEEAILTEVEAKGAYIAKMLEHPQMVEIRRLGLYMALEMPNPQAVQQVVDYALERGVIGFWFLSCPESLRLAPPLNISWEDLKWGCEILREAIDQLA